ncbi:MAG: proton-conducting transporter membrane subunit [Polyangiaceae bacterium]
MMTSTRRALTGDLDLTALVPIAMLVSAALVAGARSAALKRRLALVVLAAVLLWTVVPFVTRLVDGHGLDLVTSVLPIAIGAPLAILFAAPRSATHARACSDALLAAGSAVGVTLTESLPLFALFFLASFIPMLREAFGRREVAPTADAPAARDVPTKRAAILVASASAAPLFVALAIGAVLVLREGRVPLTLSALHGATVAHAPLSALVMIAACARLGVFPFHGWVPVALEARRGIAGPVTLASPVGIVLALRLGAPSDALLASGGATFLFACGVASALYGGVAALGQHDAGRLLGFVWISTVGAVVSGLASGDELARSGAVMHHLAVVLAASGLLIHVTAVSARTGTTDLRKLGGLVGNAPALAIGYLILSLATVSFPGTATFRSEDVLIAELYERHTVVAFVIMLATAINGISLVRSYKRLFLGRGSSPLPIEDALPRERWTAIAIVVALILGGLAPAHLVRQGVELPSGAPTVEAPR